MVQCGEKVPDLLSMWETAQREIALEGSNGCALLRLWQLVGLDGLPEHAQQEQGDVETSVKAHKHSATYLKGWLWR